MIGMDYLKSHDVILDCKTKHMSLVNDEGQRHMIVGQNHGVYLRSISFFQLQNSMHKGCKLYAILVLIEKRVAEGLQHIHVGCGA
jgi:hypothetical protein